MKIILKIAVAIALLVALAGGFLAWRWHSEPEPSRVTLQRAMIGDVAPMLRLCTVEFYDDVPVRGSAGNRHLFARMALQGSISFDLEHIDMRENADSVVLILPREIVDIYESTEDGAYQVIDTWNDRLLGSSRLTTAEENRIKATVSANYRHEIYRKGLVARARREAVAYLTELLSGLTTKTVVVADPTPRGNP